MLHDGMRQMNENLNSNRINVVQDIIQELENRAIGAGTVTYDGLQRMIQTCLSEAGINEAVQAIREPRRVADVELRPAVAEPGLVDRINKCLRASDFLMKVARLCCKCGALGTQLIDILRLKH